MESKRYHLKREMCSFSLKGHTRSCPPSTASLVRPGPRHSSLSQSTFPSLCLPRPPRPSAQPPAASRNGLRGWSPLIRWAGFGISLSLATPSSFSVGLSLPVSADIDGAARNGHFLPSSEAPSCYSSKAKSQGHFLSDKGPLPDPMAGQLHNSAYS